MHRICVGIGNNELNQYLILNCEIYCFVAVYMYRLHIGFNTSSRLRACFYFVYFPPLPHFWLWGGIQNIDFKRYHVVPYTPPNALERITTTQRG